MSFAVAKETAVVCYGFAVRNSTLQTRSRALFIHVELAVEPGLACCMQL